VNTGRREEKKEKIGPGQNHDQPPFGCGNWEGKKGRERVLNILSIGPRGYDDSIMGDLIWKRPLRQRRPEPTPSFVTERRVLRKELGGQKKWGKL